MGLSLPLSLIFAFYLVQSTVNNCSVKSLMTGFEPRSFCKRCSGYWAWTHERKRTILTLTLSLSLSLSLSFSISVHSTLLCKISVVIIFLEKFSGLSGWRTPPGWLWDKTHRGSPISFFKCSNLFHFWIMMFAYNFTGRKVPARKMCKC